ncbi:MAG: GTP-binding protein [Anaerolineae bacterium]|nr:GTP-binding protein [Anaerolineae bacterium]
MLTNTKAIPLMILTGFLGSGKTTVLNRMLHGEHGLKIAVMVNDFGAVNIDAQLIVDVDETDEMINLSNGCICCTIRGDLVKAVLQIIEREEQPDMIVIETSGVTDPIDVVLTLRAINLIKIDSVVTVIDVEQVFDAYAAYETLMLNQIGTADLVLLNKVDLVDEGHLAKVTGLVNEIAPKARLLETVQGNAPLEVLLGTHTFDMTQIDGKTAQDIHVHDSDHHHEHDDHSLIFDTWTWTSPKPLSYRALERAVDKLPLTVYRAKGILFLADDPDKRGLLHVVGKRAEVSWGEAWHSQAPQTQIVVIGKQDMLDTTALTETFEACLAENAPKSEIERVANRALAWLRGQH